MEERTFILDENEQSAFDMLLEVNRLGLLGVKIEGIRLDRTDYWYSRRTKITLLCEGAPITHCERCGTFKVGNEEILV